MKPETVILLMHSFFVVITIIFLVKIIFFGVYLIWVFVVLVAWIITWRSVEGSIKGRYHERLYMKKKRRKV